MRSGFLKRKGWIGCLAGAAMTVGLAGPVRADEGAKPVLEFRDGRFEPADLVVKAGTPTELRVVNSNKVAVEFESFELNRERVLQPGQEIVVYLPALAPGTYKFFDDFHKDRGEGTITAHE